MSAARHEDEEAADEGERNLEEREDAPSEAGPSAAQTLNGNAAKSDLDLENPPASNLNCVRLRLEWNGIVITKKIQSGKRFHKTTTEKVILNDVSGAAEPGELLAIMGPSGGGKTTLLNALSRRLKLTKGKVLLNGKKLPRNFNKISAYVMQDDRLFAVLTPRELFQFSANLRLPRGTKLAERKAMVETVIKKLKMEACADTRVGGGLMRGLSGGERKRTAIGYELITNPSLLFLDEPTSGLDSSTAFHLVQTLKELASEGHTVLSTIHQPSSDIFHMFDKLVLLVKGQVAFAGMAKEAVKFFAGVGYECPMYTNPTDFFMNILQTQSKDESARVEEILREAKKLGPSQPSSEADPKNEEDPVVPPDRPPLSTQFLELTKRSWLTTVRNPISFRARLFQYSIQALLVGCVYFNLSYTPTGARDRQGVLFFISVAQIMMSLNSILLTFPLERALLVREQSNGMYSVSSYYFGKFVSSLPLEFFFPTLFSLIVYWMVGLTSSAERFFLFYLTLICLNFASGSLGLMLGCLLPNAEVAVTIAPVIIIPFMLFAGFYISIESIPAWLRWLQYFSLFKWGFQALATNEFHDTVYSCGPEDLITGTDPDGNEISLCPITSGDQVLEQLGFEWPSGYWVAIGVIVGLFVLFRVLAFLFLVYQTKKALRKDQ